MPYERNKTRYVVLFPEDEAEISQVIKADFPGALFVQWDDREMIPVQSRNGLSDCPDTNVNIWVPPTGWEPRLSPKSGLILRPPLEVLYQRGGWIRRPDPPDSTYDLPTPDEGRFTAAFDPDDAEQRRFLRRIWKILEAHTTNKMDSYDATTLQPIGFSPNAIWVGFHAIRWCVAQPKRMLCRIVRPKPEAVARAEAALAGRPVPETPDNGSAYPRPHDAPR